MHQTLMYSVCTLPFICFQVADWASQLGEERTRALSKSEALQQACEHLAGLNNTRNNRTERLRCVFNRTDTQLQVCTAQII